MTQEMPKYLAKLLNKPITAIIDTREQYPFSLATYCPQMAIVRQKLPYGDYSLKYPNCVLSVAIERKSIDDFAQSIIKAESDPESVFNNFKSELVAIRGYKYKAVIVEGTISDVINGNYRSRVNPNSILGFITEWSGVHGIPILFANNHQAAGYICANMLWKIAMREIKEALMIGSVFPNLTVGQLQALGPINDDFLEDLSTTYQEGQALPLPF